MKLVTHFQSWPEQYFSLKTIDFFIPSDETNLSNDDKKKKMHNQAINLDLWHFLKVSQKTRLDDTNFDLQKKYHRVPRRSWSRFLAKGQENPISLNLECRFQQFGRKRPFSTEKLKFFEANLLSRKNS